MIGYRIEWVPARRQPTKPPEIERDPRFYSNIAPHIRGRVFAMGQGRWGTRWGMEVVNTHTGKVLASDNCPNFTKMTEMCDEVTTFARAVWFWDFKRKDVQ